MSGLILPVDKEVKAVPRSWMQLLSNFGATWGKIDGASFGLHCSKCGVDVTAQNGINDDVLSVRCNCREYRSERGIV